jgi:hypothetical protein
MEGLDASLVAKNEFETADAQYKDATIRREKARLAYIEALKEKAKLDWMTKHKIAIDSISIDEGTIRVQDKDLSVEWGGMRDFVFQVDDEKYRLSTDKRGRVKQSTTR